MTLALVVHDSGNLGNSLLAIKQVVYTLQVRRISVLSVLIQYLFYKSIEMKHTLFRE